MPFGCEPRAIPGGELKVDGCLATYAVCTPKLPEEGHTLGPWVAVRFINGGSIITVGNESSPQNAHNAVIKSFDFGRSDGWTCKVVIQDQIGSSLIQFMENMLKDARCASPDSLRMEVQFGWVKSGCTTPIPTAKSHCYCMYPEAIETAFDNGQFTFEVTGRDLIHAMLEQRGDKIYGQDGDNGMPLTQAIQTMMNDQELKPTISSVQFCRYEGGKCVTPKFKDCNCEEGPKGKWEMLNRTKIDTAREWLKNHRSDRDKGWKCAYQSTSCSDASIVFWEDSKPNCGEGKNWSSNCLGFYIVNGGKSSSVIEFNPRIKWDFARLTSQGGQAANQQPQMNDDGKSDGRWDCQTLNRDAITSGGSQTTVTPNEVLQETHGKNAEKEGQKSQDKAIRAEKIFHDNIEADLVIIGDPTMVNPALAPWAFNVSIAFVNPFHLIGRISTVNSDITTGGCGEWLALPTCNEVLSNRAWIVKSVGHSIREGQYTTTLGLFLTTPGDDTEVGTPIGGPGSAGWTPPASC